jgi:hydrogenase-4 component F
MRSDIHSLFQVLIIWTLAIPLVLGVAGFFLLRLRSKVYSWIVKKVFAWLTFFASVVLLVLSGWMISIFQNQTQNSIKIPFVLLDFHIDALSLYFVLLVNVITLFASWNALSIEMEGDQVEGIGSNRRGFLHSLLFFHGSLNILHFTMLLVPLVDNLIWLWIAIELTTLFSALTVGYRGVRRSWEAAWKYLIITSTGIILALLGTMFLANAVSPVMNSKDPKIIEIIQNDNVIDSLTKQPTDRIMNWTFLMEVANSRGFPDRRAKALVVISFLFILIGYGTKAGFAPLHTWLPDGHGEAPPPMSALLSGVLLKSAFYAILRFYTLTNTVLQDTTLTSSILVVTGLFSLLLAIPFILKENILKRILAYHSLEHMGIIALGVGIGGLFGGDLIDQKIHFDGLAPVPIATVAIFGALLHIFNHAILKSLMFLSFGNIYKSFSHFMMGEPLITGALHHLPWTSSILILGGLALVGMPPSNIFMSEFIILWGSFLELQSGLSPPHGSGAIFSFRNLLILITMLMLILAILLIFIGLLRHITKISLAMPMQKENKESEQAPENEITPERFSDILPLILMLAIVILLGVWIPGPFSELIVDSAKVILNY